MPTTNVIHRVVSAPTQAHAHDDYEGFGGYNRVAAEPLTRTSVTQRTKRTWDGVFLPVSLSIFGFVLFTRLPWIVGECGLWLTLLAIALCYTVTLFTTISLAAISTNGFTGDGGPYMMISRCLGPQIGTTVGLTFVMANVVATAMYLVGGVQVVLNVFDFDILTTFNTNYPYLSAVLISSSMLSMLLLISFLHVEKFFRLLCLILTLFSIGDVVVFILRTPSNPVMIPSGNETIAPLIQNSFAGLSSDRMHRNWDPQFSGSNNFQSALSILFPGVSGLMSGVCLSGDLKNGAKAMPRGIAYAWILSLVTYIIVAILVAGSMNRDVLKEHYNILREASDLYVYLPGEFCASFAAGLSMMIGSARVLRAIARDELLPFSWVKWLANASPKRAIVAYWAAIQLLLFLGDTYQYASAVATQVFLANFMALNSSTFLSAVTGMASFRPVYRFFNTTTALCGAVICLLMMFFINPLVATAVLIVMSVMLLVSDHYIDTSKVYWGDASQPLFFYVVRKWLLRLDERKEHIRHWRPSVLQIVTDPLCSLNLIHVTNNLKKGGLYEMAVVVQGSFHDTASLCFRWKGWLMDFIGASGIKAFGVVTFGPDLRTATQQLLRTCGLGGMRPNTVVLSMDEVLQREYFMKIYDAYSGHIASFGSHTVVGTRADFGAVRPLKDVNNRRTEFWDLKRDDKGNVISAHTFHHDEDVDDDDDDEKTSAHRHHHHHHHGERDRRREEIADDVHPMGAPHSNVQITTSGLLLEEANERSSLLSRADDESDGRNRATASIPCRTSKRLSSCEPMHTNEAGGEQVEDLAATLRLGAGSLRTMRRVRIVTPQESTQLHHANASTPGESASLSRLATSLINKQMKSHRRTSAAGSGGSPPASPPTPGEDKGAQQPSSSLSPPGSPGSRRRTSQVATSGTAKKGTSSSKSEELDELENSYVAVQSESGSEITTNSRPSSRHSSVISESAPDKNNNNGPMLSLDDQNDLLVPDIAHTTTTGKRRGISIKDNVVQPMRRTAEEFGEWLRRTMHGQFGDHRSNSAPDLLSSSTTLRSTAMKSTTSVHHERHVSEPIPLPDRGDSGSTTRYVQQTMMRAHEVKKPTGWGLFRTARDDANACLEQRLIERMIAQRHAARLTGDCDICGFEDILEFCNISRDVSTMQMNLVIARNMDHLNMEELIARPKGHVYIDVWIPHESDAILFLMSYCFSMTSVWRKHAILRIVAIVTLNDEIDEEVERLETLMREHRIIAVVKVISLEEEMRERSMHHPDEIEKLFETQEGRAQVMNAVMKREVERNENRTALIFVRVESYAGGDSGEDAEEASEEWFSNLVTLTHQLPPMLLLAAGSLKCRSNDW